MKSDFLLDTDVIIYYLQRQLLAAAEKIIDDIVDGHYTSLSIITEIEF